MPLPKSLPLPRTLRLSLWLLGGALLLYVLAGFLVLPLLMKSQLERVAQEQLARQLRFESLHLDPFRLSVSVRGGLLLARDGTELLGFDELHANLQLWPLLRNELALDELRLTAPDLKLRILENGELSFADLFEDDAESEAQPPETAADDALGFHLELLRIERGRVLFTDASRPSGFREVIEPFDLTLRNLGTRTGAQAAYEARVSLEDAASLTFDGVLSLEPLNASGHVTLLGLELRGGWRYLRDELGFEVVQGQADVETDYRVGREGDALAVQVSAGRASLRDLEIVDPNGDPVLGLPSLELEGVELDLGEARLRVEALRSQGAQLHVRRETDGRMRVQSLRKQREDREEQPAASDASAAAWQLELAALELSDYHVSIEDLTPAQTLQLELAPIALRATGLANAEGSKAELELSVGVKDGSLSAQGSLGLSPLSGDFAVQLRELDLSAAQPYIAEALRLELQSARASAEGRLALSAASQATPVLQYLGELRIDDLRTVEQSGERRLLKWSSVALSGLRLDLAPDRVEIAEIRARGAELYIAIDARGELNLAQLARGEDTASAPAAASRAASSEATLPVEIGVIEIEESAIEFEDLSIEPSYRADLVALEGAIRGISSRTGNRSQIRLTGRVDGTSPLEIEGSANLLAAQAFTDLTMRVQRVEMARFSPYSGRFAGLTIERGSLGLDLSYRLEDRTLVAENQLLLDQLEFGEKIDSPDATKLPIRLAVELLENAKGEIHASLPVRGNLDDPGFNLGGALLGAFSNLITRVVSSPFAMIGGLVGSSEEELSFVAFAPGSPELDPDQAAKLELLARALGQRPKLRLQIDAVSERPADTQGLRRTELNARLLAGDSALSAAERRERLLDLYRETFDESPERLISRSPTPDVSSSSDSAAGNAEAGGQNRLEAEVERRLLARIAVADAELESLAQRRLEVVRGRLVELEVPGDRLLASAPRVEPGGAVDAATVNTRFVLETGAP